MRETSRPIVLLCCMAALPVLGGTSLGAIYPILRQVLHLSGPSMSVVVAISTLSLIVTSPFVGALADRVGPVRVILPLLLLYALGAFLSGCSAFAGSGGYACLVAGRMLQGVGGLGTGPLAIAFVKRLLGERAAARMAWLEASASGGAVVGPVIGGLIAGWKWHLIFWLDGGAMLVLMLLWGLSLRGITPAAGGPGAGSPSRGMPALALTRRILGAYLGGFGLMFALVGMQTFLVDYLETAYGVPIPAGGAVVAAHALLMASTAALSGRYLRPGRSGVMIVAGLVVFASALILLGLQLNLYLGVASVIAGGIGCGLILPPGNVLVLHEASAGTESRAMSLASSLRSIGVLLGSASAGWLTTLGYPTLFVASGAAVAAIAGVAIGLFAVRPARVRGVEAGRRP